MSDNDPQEAFNPFAAPTVSDAIEPIAGDPIPPPQLPHVFVKWLLVCGAAAGPSFALGGGMGGWRFSAVLGMIIGVMIFVIGYTALEFTTAVQQQMGKPVSRRSAWIAYLTRVAISIIFPIGVFIDMFCGLMAVGFSSTVVGFRENYAGSRNGVTFDNFSSLECFQFAFTTVVQGVILNLVLFAYMGIVWLVCNAANKSRSR